MAVNVDLAALWEGFRIFVFRVERVRIKRIQIFLAILL